jgi:hypothetical protein
MKISGFKILLAFTFIILPRTNIYSQQPMRFQVIDSKYKTPISYAYVKVLNKNILEVTNQDGFFFLPQLKNDSINISHVAYKSIETLYSKIQKDKIILLDEVPIEINPITISAKDTRRIIDNSIEKNYKVLTKPLYLICFRKDILLYQDTLVAEAYAEILFKVDHLFSPSRGGIVKCYLQNIIVNKNLHFNMSVIPKFDLEANFSPINRFIIGASNGPEKFIYFSKQESGDSIIIINVNPRLDFKPNKRLFLKNARFIINNITRKIQRIDTSISPEMMEMSRSDEYRSKSAKRYFYNYLYSEFFNPEGMISKVFWECKFSYLENNPQKLWENRSELIFTQPINMPVLGEKPLELKNDTTLVQMNSNFKYGFDHKIETIF